MAIMDIVKKLHGQIDYDAYRNCKDRHHSAGDCIECCKKPYFEQTNIDYTCEQKRKIYIVRYVPAYISEVSSVLAVTPKEFLEDICQKEEITVASIGGGPGTDIAAFNKWISRKVEWGDALERVRYLRIDNHQQWVDVSPELIHLYKSDDIDFDFWKINRDVSKTSVNAKNFKKFDVVMLSYIISEIESQKIKRLAKNVLKVISERTLVIINDRPQKEVIEKIARFLNEIGAKEPMVIEPLDRDHCGESYPDEIYERVQPTIFRKSIRYNILVSR